MNKIARILLSIPLGILALSCNKPSDSAAKTADAGVGSVAIVDLDKVAKAMGWTDDMQKNLQQTQSSVADQLKGALRPNQLALENKRDEIVKALSLNASQINDLTNARSKTDLQKLGLSGKQIDDLGGALAMVANDNVSANQQLNQVINAQRAKIIETYREAAKPAVRRVAIANNKSVVLTVGPELLFSDANSDLSDKVVDDLQHSNAGKVELPPIPVLSIQSPQQTTGPTTRPKS